MSNFTKLMMQAAAGAGGGGVEWDISYAYYDAQSAAFTGNYTSFYELLRYDSGKSVSAQETYPTGVFVSPDGLNFYVVGYISDSVHQYTTTDAWRAWDPTLIPFSQSFSVATEETTPRDLFFKDDGTKMYIIGSDTDYVYEYSLSTAWDISTASLNQSFYVGTQETTPHGLFFSTDGTNMYIAGDSGNGIDQYQLSTAWDISTASHLQFYTTSTTANGSISSPTGVTFNSDGDIMFVVQSSSTDKLARYTLSTAWDVSTATYQEYTGLPFSSAGETYPQGICFSPKGNYMYMTGTGSDDIHNYIVGGFDISSQTGLPTGIQFKPDGSKMYISGQTNPDSIYEYDLSTAWDVNTASYSQSLDVSANADVPQDIYFKSDGTKMYILNSSTVISNRKVVEYSLSTAWDISTGSYVQNFGVGSQAANSLGMYFSDDGSKMYVACQTNDAVYEYDLSTAWDVSTASYSQSFDISSEELNVTNLTFGDSGKKMYTVSNSSLDITQYDLSTAWDISTASYRQQYYAHVGIRPNSIYFKDDGTQFFVADSTKDCVFAFSISDGSDE